MVRLLHSIICRNLILSFALVGFGTGAIAQPTNIAIGTTAIQPSVKRLGMNLSFQSFYDSGQMTKNLVFRNPGFEGQIYQSTIRCASGTAASCVDDNAYSAWPAGFWNGATVEIIYGKAQGRKDTVANYSAASNSVGGTLTFGGAGVAPALGDYLILRKSFPGNAVAGWWPTSSGGGSVTTNTADLPPGTAGLQTASLNAPGAADSAVLSSYFDTTQGRSFITLNGTFQLTFKAKGTGGANSIALSLQRYGAAPFLMQTVPLTSAWASYSFTFNAAESGSLVGAVGLNFATKGQDSFLLDDVSLTQINSDPTNASVFRDSVVNALRALNPGELRFWANQLGDTLDNLIAPPYARLRSGFSAWSSKQEDISYGLPEFLQLCETVGAEPWVVVPITFTPAEASNLIEFLSGATSTPYGAKRAALGHSAPWSSAFSKIHLEFGNEAWNGGFKGGIIEYSAPYGQRAQTIFGAMRGNASYVASAFDLVLGGQAVWPGRNQDIQNNCNNNDTFALAPYMMNTVDQYASNEALFGPSYAEGEAFYTASGAAEGVSNGMMLQNLQAMKASNHPVPLALYEINLSTLAGAIPQATLNAYAPSLGAGLAVVGSMLQHLRQGVINQNMFALQQYNFVRPDGKTAPLWGAVVDMGATDRRRPQFLAMQLANQAIGSNSSMLQTLHSGADPTWNQPLTNTVQLNGAHYLQSFAFASSGQKSVVVFNLHRTLSLPVTFAGANAPFGAVTQRQMTSASPADTNEDSAKVNITTQALSAFNAATGLSLPPNSMTVLTWSAGSTPAPVISALAAAGVTGTSATITWTTDQASDSQVQYGLGGLLSSLLPVNAALVTQHSMVLTGLTAGTTYSYAVQSTNAQGLASTSASLTFTTTGAPPSGPVISGVTATAITTTSATVNWTTDKASSTQVLYGTAASYGATSPLNSSAVTAHATILTGLTPGTTYNYAVSSVSSGGTTTSANFTFATTAAAPNGPVISGVAATGIGDTTASISWSTDKASTTQVLYGVTTAYGSASALNSTATTAHTAALANLSPGTTYNFAVASVASGGTTTSTNYTFTTTASAAPVISAVQASGMTDTTANITWTTDKASTTQVLYGTTAAYGSASALNSSNVSAHAMTLTGLKAGTTYNFAVASVGAGGTATSTNYTLTTSTVSAAPVISAVVASGVTDTTAVISWTTDKTATTQVLYGPTTAYAYASALNATAVTAHTVTLANLTPGATYNFAVASVGTGGTTTSVNYTFTTGASAAPVVSAVQASGVTDTSVTITWLTDKASTTQVLYGSSTAYGYVSALNASPVTAHSATLANLTAGATYNFAVASIGTGGTTTSTNFTFTTSTVSAAPVISGVTASALSSNSALITWVTDKPSTSQVLFGATPAYGNASTFLAAPVTAHSMTLSGLTAGAVYHFAVASVGTGGTTISPNYTYSGAASAPAASVLTISGVSATNVSATAATILWNTSAAATSQVIYGGLATALDGALVTVHAMALTGLTPGTSYTYTAASTDAGGVTAKSASFTFTTNAVASAGNGPVVSTPAFWGISGSGVTISWSTNEASDTAVEFGTTTALGQTSPLQPALVASHGITLTGLAPGTAYYFRGRSRNASGGIGYSNIYSFSTLDTGGPVISNIVATPGPNHSATASWTISKAATTQVEYGPDTNYGRWSAVTSGTQTALGWVPSGVIHYRVRSMDAAGNMTVTGDFTFVEP